MRLSKISQQTMAESGRDLTDISDNLPDPPKCKICKSKMVNYQGHFVCPDCGHIKYNFKWER